MVRKKLRTFQARDEMLRIMSERKKKKKGDLDYPSIIAFYAKNTENCSVCSSRPVSYRTLSDIILPSC